MSPCLTAIDIGRARGLPSTWFGRSYSTTAHGSPGPTAQRGCLQCYYRKHIPGTCRSCTHPATVCMEDGPWRRRRGSQAGHTLHETCERIVQTNCRAIRRGHRPQCAAVSSSLVWTSCCAVWAAVVRDSAHTHRYSPRCTLESRLLASDSFDVDFASVKSVSLWQFLRLGHLCQRSYYSRLSIAAPSLPHY